MKRGEFLFTLAAGLTAAEKVTVTRLPSGCLQPQTAVDESGTLHLIYFSGEPAGGDVFYMRRTRGAQEFSKPLRVNSQPGSVIAAGTVRGAHIAAGKGGRVHVAWMGSKLAEPKGPNNAAPMLYTRWNGRAFEAQCNVMQHADGLDGGGSLAADRAGNVYVAWHGHGDAKGEENRRVWIARSSDEGATFAREGPAFKENTGACACCGMRVFADSRGEVFILYRSAVEAVHRDMYLLNSSDHGRSFGGTKVHEWEIKACPMSTAQFAESGGRVLLAWETEKQVWWTGFDPRPGTLSKPVAAPGAGSRKHPAIAVNSAGEILLAWAEGTSFRKGGSVGWQLYRDGKPAGDPGQAPDLPAFSLAAAVARPGGGFEIIY